MFRMSISIIIPTYEQSGYGAKHLHELLTSIVQQDFTDYDIVVSDNATDGSIKSVCDQFPVKYNHNPIRGASENMSNAINLASHDKIKIMCQDDIMLPGCLKLFNAALNSHGWVITNSNHINIEGRQTGMRVAQYQHGKFDTNTVGMPSCIGFRKCNLRFLPELKTVCDMYFYHQLYELYGPPGKIVQQTVAQRFHNFSLSRVQENKHAQDVRYLIKNKLIPGSLPRVVVAVICYDRVENIKRWADIWQKCNTDGAQLVVIHTAPGEVKADGFIYIKADNDGQDIGAMKRVCNGTLPGFPDYDYLLWCADDTVPMDRDFINKFIDCFGKNTGVVCMHLSTEIRPHIRTTGFMIPKTVARRLNFGTVKGRRQCLSFEMNFLPQIQRMRLTVTQVAPLPFSPLWDMNYQTRNNDAKKLIHLLDRQKELDAIHPAH